ncbi:nuclear transport factor 2 family protein [Pseudooceanicola sp. 502str34]
MPRLPAPVAAYIAACNAGDVDGMLAQLAQDALYQAIHGGEITAEAVNRAEFEHLARARPGFTSQQLSVTQAITVGDTTALRLRRALAPCPQDTPTPVRDPSQDPAPAWMQATPPRSGAPARGRAGTALFRLRRERIIRILVSD